jgi:hypothetical protein
LYFPCTAISGRNAVTFSGNLSPVSARSREIHSVRVVRVASNNLATSSSFIFCVKVVGDSFAAHKISSE